nr:reverse transcriptase domain-containing protein [Tanacetum cinerariifolium]
MRTRSKSYPINSKETIPRRSNRRRVPNIVKPEICTIEEVVPMVILEILAKNFEIKTKLLQLVQTNKFHSFERDNPHTHISNFKRMTVTLKYRDVSKDAIKLTLFPYSLEGAARIYNKTAKDLWDTLARHMLGSEYGKQDRKAAVLYEYETFKATEGELLLDTYILYLQVINDLKKCGYSKDNCELNFKFLNNLQPKWKQYATMMRQNKNLMDINIYALYNILKQNQGNVNDAIRLKKKTIMVTYDPLALIADKTNSANKKQEFVKTDNKKVK